MRWRGRRQSTNISDRRGQGPARIPGGFGRRGPRIPIPIGRAGAGGMSGIVILVVVFLVLSFLGINPMDMMGGGGSAPPTGQVTRQQPGNDEQAQFVGVVLAETEDVWNGIFQSEGETYQEPTLVMFDGVVNSACGQASSAVGPFYCPNDNQVYIDLAFFDELASRFGASGDFAQAYVIAHEVGHHVQNLTGILPQFHQQRQRMSEAQANEMSVRVELQADCYAGVWAHYTEQKGLLEAGDIDEALNAAHQIGDDTLQRRTQGQVMPDSFTHGSSEQRQTWFARGYETGRWQDCDTFNGDI
ncbi:neutral zinc metallopeptidase [Aliihoeflea sp. 40Bstr573]|uniref:KPN_02809 family neutral zinc metallopeptidase n=1 Tax=Aliihoeflea sp. 40Bstr573 TaxID=2696467 RepID=UPI00209497F8|nr:neutral zinc metallopeptidase [Aliihoeflea sp. 40Bstr573]MCO6388489.1 flagellar biosynthesis protein FlgM [Aliihoeflea sp. 40Bstr573]